MKEQEKSNECHLPMIKQNRRQLMKGQETQKQ